MTSSAQTGPAAVVGTPSWGVTLGLLMARRGIDVRLLARSPEEAGRLESARELEDRLPGHRFPDALRVTADWAAGLAGAAAVLFAVPSNTLRENARRARPNLGGGPVVVSACKGLECGTLARMSVVLAEELGGAPSVIMSGGSSHSQNVFLTRALEKILSERELKRSQHQELRKSCEITLSECPLSLPA